MRLSKTRYTQGIQCPKMLWMREHMPDQFDDSIMNQTVLDNGNKVGDLAMGYFGDFVEVPFSEDMQDMVDKTQELLGQGVPVICEASFAYDGNFCSVDILRVDDEGAVDLIEVKSSTHMNPVYYHDVAYQRWVLQQCGLRVKTTSLMHLNPAYVRAGELDLHQLFVIEDISAQSEEMLAGVATSVGLLKNCADMPVEPVWEPGEQCVRPYKCGFAAWCMRSLPSPNVLDINGLRKKYELMHRGITSFDEVLASGVKLNLRQEEQVRAQVEGLELFCDKKKIRQFLRLLDGPLYFFDFETFQPAVPLFEGTRPYQQIPTQYSLHIVRELGEPGQVHDDGEGTCGPVDGAIAMEHREFLAQAGSDPRRALAEAICRDIPAGACCVAYNMTFERSRLTELAECCPDLASHLLSIRDGFRDLIVPFKSGAYYVPAMGGSNSIKAVLPALFPDSAELDYAALEGVHQGAQAAACFESLAELDHASAERARGQLLAYCRLDTLAMVRIWEFLREASV